MSRRTRRRFFAALGAVAAIAAAGFAIAYFTTSGSGTGTASVGTSTALTIHGTAGTTLYPGTSSTVNFTVDNPSSGHQQLGTIHLNAIVACNTAFVSGTCPSGHEVTSCESADSNASSSTDNFSMPDVVSGQDIAGSATGASVTATGTLTMNNLSSSQDACKNANLQLNFTS
jgi:hypothetical protein